MGTILIADDEPVARELLKKILEKQGHTVAAVANGRAALAAVQMRIPDLVLLDLAMPEMDGVKFLRHLRVHPGGRTTPVIVLTAVSDPRLVQVVARLGVRSYLLKGKFSWDVMESRIQQELSRRGSVAAPTKGPAAAVNTAAPAAALPAEPSPPASPPPAPLTREQTIERVEQHTASKTLAGVVAEVIGMASSPRGSVADLVGLIKRDAVLATRVLQVANTAAFTTNKPRVATVDEAVRNVGSSAVRNIATTVGIFEAFPPDAADGFNLMRCWQHGFAVAAILERITAQLAEVPPGAAHLVGLCHDLAEIVLRECFPDRYESASAGAAAAGRTLADAQAAAFGVPTHELASLIVAKIALPPPIANPIREYAELTRRRGGGAPSELAQALRLADLYAHGLLLASSPHAGVAPLSQAECRSAVGQASPEPVDGTVLRSEVLATASLFARLSAKDERKLAQPLFARREGVRLWYARHRSFSPWDPLEVALSQLCAVRVEDRMPRADELSELDGVLLATPRLSAGGLGAEMPTAGVGVPMLYLVGTLEEGSPRPPCLRTYPVSLSDLAAFVESIEAGKCDKPRLVAA